ncbi:MAG TPA: hypothetical protein VMW62_18305 [Chloroflexota bacterium]|nr:hypothetical protein [Chloroflexota bacterium]
MFLENDKRRAGLVTSSETLDALIETLEQIRNILPTDKAIWDSQPVIRLAVERVWITAGNLAEAYRIDRSIGSGVEPWSELAGYRNLLAHALPGDISSDRVFVDSSADIDSILDQLRAEIR